MHANVSRLILVLLLIGRKSGANLLSQSCGVESAKSITFRHSNENRSKLRWDFQNKVKSGWTGSSSFVLEVPLSYLRPSVIYSVPCDRILQRAYRIYLSYVSQSNQNRCPKFVRKFNIRNKTRELLFFVFASNLINGICHSYPHSSKPVALDNQTEF